MNVHLESLISDLLTFTHTKNASTPLNVAELLSKKLLIKDPCPKRKAEIRERLLKLKKINSNFQVIAFHEDKYPKTLKTLPDPPVTLFALGDTKLLNNPLISAVGSRNHTQEGQARVFSLCKALKGTDISLCSGIARGIDESIHKYSIKNEIKTIAVLPFGFGYSIGNHTTKLISSIIKNGGLIISEYLPFQETRKSHFEFRNRIIAGMGLSTFIIEARKNSGALITARHCERYNRKIFMPWLSTENPNSEGLEHILRHYPNASLYRNPIELIEESKLSLFAPLSPLSASQQISKNALEIINFLKNGPANFATLSQALSLYENELKNSLLELISAEVIHESNGQWFFLVNN